MLTKFQKVVERAKRDPNARFNSLAHLIDVNTLRTAFRGLRPGAAAGVDGVSKAGYAVNLEANLQALHTRLKDGTYRHREILRVEIPKGKGKTREQEEPLQLLSPSSISLASPRTRTSIPRARTNSSQQAA